MPPNRLDRREALVRVLDRYAKPASPGQLGFGFGAKKPEPAPIRGTQGRLFGGNCGTGAGGFQPGNTCAKGKGDQEAKPEDGGRPAFPASSAISVKRLEMEAGIRAIHPRDEHEARKRGDYLNRKARGEVEPGPVRHTARSAAALDDEALVAAYKDMKKSPGWNHPLTLEIRKRGLIGPNGVGLDRPEGKAQDEGPPSLSDAKPEAKAPEREPESEQAVAAPPPADDSPPTIEGHTRLMARVKSGEASADELRAGFEKVASKEGREAIEAELSKRTLKQLAPGGTGGLKKEDIVARIYDNLLGRYSLGESTSFMAPVGKGPEAWHEAKVGSIRAVLAKLDDEAIKAFSGGIQEAKADRDRVLSDPKTIDEFRAFIDAKGASALTEEQRERFDDLVADYRRARDAASKAAKAAVPGFGAGAEATGEVGIVEGYHQKRGQANWTVTVEERLGDEKFQEALSRAKALGGSYVNAMIARRYGATPGFQFFDQEKAEQFRKVLAGESVDRAEDVEARRVERIENAGERFAAMAEGIRAKAQEELARPRLANTARRAGIAESMEARARSELAMADTMDNIAQAIREGGAKHLAGLRSRTHLEALERTLRHAKWEAYREKAKTERGLDWEEFSRAPATKEDATAARYPYPRIWASDLQKYAKELADVPGVKRLAARLGKAGAQQVKFKGSAGGFKLNGGRLVDPSALEHTRGLEHATGGKFIRVHVSYDWRLAQAAGRTHGEFYTADAGKTWGADPEIAIQAAARRDPDALDLVERQQDELLDIDAPGDIKAMAEVARRLRRNPDRKLQRVAGELADRIAEYNRLQAADIKSPAELRAALREYLPFKGRREAADPVKKLERALVGKKIPGFFPTPQALGERLLGAADIQPGHAVLEPSAGKGDLLDLIREKHPDASATAVEPVSSLREILQAKGHALAGDDFLGHDGQYDRIVMNPPFEDGQDAEHVRHAYDLLKPGGRLVAIMSSGPFHRQAKKDAEFRGWLESVRGEHEELPDGSFAGPDAFRQTGVSTRMVTIDKPEGEPEKPDRNWRIRAAALRAVLDRYAKPSSPGQMGLFGGESSGPAKTQGRLFGRSACGAGPGGFQKGNTCAKGGAAPKAKPAPREKSDQELSWDAYDARVDAANRDFDANDPDKVGLLLGHTEDQIAHHRRARERADDPAERGRLDKLIGGLERERSVLSDLMKLATAKEDGRRPEVRRKVIGHLMDNTGQFDAKAVAEAIGESRKTVDGILWSLANEGRVRRFPNAGRGGETAYDIEPEEDDEPAGPSPREKAKAAALARTGGRRPIDLGPEHDPDAIDLPDAPASHDSAAASEREKLAAKLERIEKRMESLNRTIHGGRTAEVSEHFHLGTVGRSGRPVRQLNKIRGRDLDRTIDASKEWVKLRGDAADLRGKIAEIDSGKRAKKLADLEAKREAKAARPKQTQDHGAAIARGLQSDGRHTLSDGAVVSWRYHEASPGDLVCVVDLEKPGGETISVVEPSGAPARAWKAAQKLAKDYLAKKPPDRHQAIRSAALRSVLERYSR